MRDVIIRNILDNSQNGKLDLEEYIEDDIKEELIEKIKEEKKTEKAEEEIWECRNCGHLVMGKKAPELCPVCKHPQSYFEVRKENY